MQSRERYQKIRDTYHLRQAYNRAYKELELSQLFSFYRWIVSLLPIVDGQSFLDVSCGRGQLVALARERGMEAYGVDISDQAVAQAKFTLGEDRVLVGDGERLPFSDSSFRVVTNLGSIEHYLHPTAGMSEIARVLDNNGIASILLPNSYSLLENIWSVWLTGDIGDQGQPVERYATRSEWERLLSNNGLVVTRTMAYNLTVPRTWEDWMWYVKRPRRLLWLVLALGVPLNLSGCFVFMCRKRIDEVWGD